MAAFLWKQRLHRLVPGSSQAPSPDEVTAAWTRLAEERETILAWARSTRMLIEIVQTYRFRAAPGRLLLERSCRRGHGGREGGSVHRRPMTWAGVCIEWAEREHRQWFWRCCGITSCCNAAYSFQPRIRVDRMCNLYSVRSSAAEIAVHFGVRDPPQLDIPAEIEPGEPGIIVRQGAGGRVIQSLRWGFPRPQADRDGNPLHLKPVNLVADLTNPCRTGWSLTRATAA